MKRLASLTLTAVACLAGAAAAQDASMSFFVTSANPGQGADFGGIEGADAHCASLAEAAGVGGKTWRAYLSTSAENARDRIGTGPWFNAAGVEIAASVDALHGDANAINKETALDETGAVVNGRGDEPNRHDILTGSLPGRHRRRADLRGLDQQRRRGGDGRTSRPHGLGRDPSVVVMELVASLPAAAASKRFASTGGDGLLYCFAAD